MKLGYLSFRALVGSGTVSKVLRTFNCLIQFMFKKWRSGSYNCARFFSKPEEKEDTAEISSILSVGLCCSARLLVKLDFARNTIFPLPILYLWAVSTTNKVDLLSSCPSSLISRLVSDLFPLQVSQSAETGALLTYQYQSTFCKNTSLIRLSVLLNTIIFHTFCWTCGKHHSCSPLPPRFGVTCEKCYWCHLLQPFFTTALPSSSTTTESHRSGSQTF